MTMLGELAVCLVCGSNWPCSACGPGRTDAGWWPWPRWTWWGQDRRTTCAQRCHCDQTSFLSLTPYSRSGHKASLYTLNTKHSYIYKKVKILQTTTPQPLLTQKILKALESKPDRDIFAKPHTLLPIVYSSLFKHTSVTEQQTSSP